MKGRLLVPLGVVFFASWGFASLLQDRAEEALAVELEKVARWAAYQHVAGDSPHLYGAIKEYSEYVWSLGDPDWDSLLRLQLAGYLKLKETGQKAQARELIAETERACRASSNANCEVLIKKALASCGE